MDYIQAIGRRKTAVARVYLKPADVTGEGKTLINRREAGEYLNNDLLRLKVDRPFKLLDLAQPNFDVTITVDGGGVNGQAEAIRLGISRALQLLNVEWRAPLKKEGLLSVDSRQVERKKYGRKKARKRFQFSKR